MGIDRGIIGMTRVSIPRQSIINFAAMRDWCIDNFGESGARWYWEPYYRDTDNGEVIDCRFANDADATLFALRWL
jgi:hypothetical protein